MWTIIHTSHLARAAAVADAEADGMRALCELPRAELAASWAAVPSAAADKSRRQGP